MFTINLSFLKKIEQVPDNNWNADDTDDLGFHKYKNCLSLNIRENLGHPCHLRSS